MNRLFGGLFALALGMGSATAVAQTGGAKPTCAAGDIAVWENTSTKAYHLPGDKYYGNTKHGVYACRSAADSAGYHLAGGKSQMNAATPPAMAPSPAPVESEAPAASHHGKHHHKAGSSASPAPSPAAT